MSKLIARSQEREKKRTYIFIPESKKSSVHKELKILKRHSIVTRLSFLFF